MDINLKNEIKEAILNYTSGKKFSPCSKEELVEHFAGYYQKDDVKEVVVSMLENYDLVMTSRKNIQNARSSGIFTGEVTGVNDDYVYVKVDGEAEDYRISRKGFEAVFPKSKVVIKSYNFEGSNGEIVKVLEEGKSTFIGEVVVEGYKEGKYEYYIKPESKRIGYTLHLSKEECQDLVDGHIVEFKVEGTKKGLVPHLVRVVGHATDIGMDIKRKALEAEVPIDFSEESEQQAENTPNVVREEDKVGRVDYTGDDHLIITIDGADTKDRDDAYEIYKLEDGTIHVKVHIADVAHYVPEGSPIDMDAFERGTSCYLADRVIPMLPRKLSNGICSLDPNVERLAVSYEFNIYEDGTVGEFEVKESFIKSKKAFTYDEVQAIYEGDKKACKANEQYLELFKISFEASERLSKRKAKNGELKLDTREPKLIVDSQGKLIDVKVRIQRESERLIEDLMVATNEAGAKLICDMGLKFLFRNHEYPDLEKLEANFIPMCKSLKISPRFQNDNFAFEYKRIMSLVDDQTVRSALSDAFLRCLPKAVYAPDEIGHFGLSLDYYAQLTSPIRRFPDLINERILKKLCHLNEHEENYIEILDMYEELVALGQSTSSQEKRADQLERDTNKMKFAEYMENHIGEVYKVKVSGFSKNGIFVELPNTIEGMIPFKYINKDQFTYDDNRKVAIGKRTGEVFTLGTPLEVSVRRASKADSQIDFALIRRLDQPKSVSDDRKKKPRR